MKNSQQFLELAKVSCKNLRKNSELNRIITFLKNSSHIQKSKMFFVLGYMSQHENTSFIHVFSFSLKRNWCPISSWNTDRTRFVASDVLTSAFNCKTFFNEESNRYHVLNRSEIYQEENDSKRDIQLTSLLISFEVAYLSFWKHFS